MTVKFNLIAAVAMAAAMLLGCSSSNGDEAKQDYEVGYCGEPEANMGGGGTTDTQEYVVYFPVTKLAPYVGGEVRSIKVAYSDYSRNPETFEFEVLLYAKGTSTQPGIKLFDKVVTLSKGWNEIPLDSPVVIDASTELWAGYSINCDNYWPMAYDSETWIPGVLYFRYSGSTGYSRISAPNNLCLRLDVAM